MAGLESGSVYRLAVRHDPLLAWEKLREIRGLTLTRQPNIDDNAIEFAIGSGAGDDVIDCVARKILDSGYGLKEIALKTRSLEEVFFQLTQ